MKFWCNFDILRISVQKLSSNYIWFSKHLFHISRIPFLSGNSNFDEKLLTNSMHTPHRRLSITMMIDDELCVRHASLNEPPESRAIKLKLMEFIWLHIEIIRIAFSSLQYLHWCNNNNNDKKEFPIFNISFFIAISCNWLKRWTLNKWTYYRKKYIFFFILKTSLHDECSALKQYRTKCNIIVWYRLQNE